MPRVDYRIAAAERYRCLAGERRGRAAKAVRGLRLLAGYYLQRGLDVPLGLLDGLRTRVPPKSAGTEPDAPGFLVIGHRGSPRRRVENTIESVRHAVEVDGANAVEIDLSLTKDGHVVLWHDWMPNDNVALARQLGIEPSVKCAPDAPGFWSDWRRPVHELTLAELREHYGYQRKFLLVFGRRVEARIPTLGEFLEWADAATALRVVFLDLKLPVERVDLAPRFTSALCEALDARPRRFEAVFMTPHVEVLDAIKALTPERLFSYDIEIPPLSTEPEAYSGTRAAIEHTNEYASIGRPALRFGAFGVYRKIIANDVKLRRDHNARGAPPPVRRLISWTINKRRESQSLLRLGVQGILTDNPRRLRRYARRLGRRLA